MNVCVNNGVFSKFSIVVSARNQKTSTVTMSWRGVKRKELQKMVQILNSIYRLYESQEEKKSQKLLLSEDQKGKGSQSVAIVWRVGKEQMKGNTWTRDGVSHRSFRKRGLENNYAPYCVWLIPGTSNWPLFVCLDVSGRTAFRRTAVVIFCWPRGWGGS